VIHQLTESVVDAKKAPVSQWCRLMGVSRSGFYAARQRMKEPESVNPLAVHARAAFEASGRNYGSRRLSAALRAKGVAGGPLPSTAADAQQPPAGALAAQVRSHHG
jgi:putative transposase